MSHIENVDVSERYRIAVYADHDIQEPDKDDTAIVYHRYFGERHNNGIAEVPELTREQIKNNVSDIVALFNCRSLLHATTEHSSLYRQQYSNTAYSNAVELVNDSIQCAYAEQSDRDKSEWTETIYRIAGYTVASGTHNGFSQGDSVDYVLASKEDGLTEEYLHDIQQEHSAWAFGSGYGYCVERYDDEFDSWEETECSCWGFYGDLSGGFPDYMIEDAKENISFLEREDEVQVKIQAWHAVRQIARPNRQSIARKPLVLSRSRMHGSIVHAS